MGYTPPLTTDVTTPQGSPVATLVGTANVESIIRANALNQLATATGNYSMGGFRTTSQGQGIVSTDSSSVGQGLGAVVMPFVISGCAWTADSSGSTLNGSMSAGTMMIKGVLLTVAAVTAHAFTASRDTYIDLADNGDGTANITYTAVVNNGLSPALANSGTVLNTIRVAIVVSGASAITTGGINQGLPSFSTPTALGSSTVAAGSNGANITATPLNVAAGANFSTGGGWCTVAHSTMTYTIQYTGVSSNTLTGVTVLEGTGTVSTGDVVTQVLPIAVADLLGNRIFPTTGMPGLVGYSTFTNAYTTTSTTSGIAIPSTIAPFIVPAGPNRDIKVTFNAPFFGTSAVAGTSNNINIVLGNNSSTLSSGQMKVAVASDGAPVTLLGATQLAAGSYMASITATQGASGTLSIGVLYVTTQLVVELA